MRKLLCMLLCMSILLPLLPMGSAAAEAVPLAVEAPETVIRPGKAILLSFSVPAAGTCDLLLRDAQGETVQPIVLDYPVTTGSHQLWWNGTYMGVPVPEGTYALVIRQGSLEASVPVPVGSFAPYLTSISAVKDVEACVMDVSFYASVDGLLTVGVWLETAWTLLESRQILAGPNTYSWDAAEMAEA